MLKLTDKQIMKVDAMAKKGGYADFLYLDAKTVKAERKIHADALRTLDKILAIIAPPKPKKPAEEKKADWA